MSLPPERTPTDRSGSSRTPERSRAWQTPSLRVGDEGDRHATWLELFFDLVFVVAIAALAGILHDDLSPIGFLGFFLLFVPVGWTWMSFAYYSDQFDTDDALFRMVMLAAMLASAALAVNVEGALGGGSFGFVAANVVLRVLLVGLYLWAFATEARPLSARFFATGFAAGGTIWLASLLVPEPVRYGLWALALLVEMATPVFGYSRASSVPGHASHMPERFGLFTIIVLGESIVVLTAAVIGADWRPASALAAALGFVIAACLWWLYFDRVDEGAIAQSFTDGAAGVVRSHVWGYGHLAVWAGIVTASIGIEFAVLATPGSALGLGPRVAVCGGITLYLLAVSAIQLATPTSLPAGVLLARAAVAAVALLLLAAGAYFGPALLVGLLAPALVTLTAFEGSRPRPRGAKGAEDAPA